MGFKNSGFGPKAPHHPAHFARSQVNIRKKVAILAQAKVIHVIGWGATFQIARMGCTPSGPFKQITRTPQIAGQFVKALISGASVNES